MKKFLALAVLATTLVACDKSDLEEVEEQVLELREKEDQKKNEKTQAQKTEFLLWNSKIVGVKTDAPQGKQSDYSPNKDKNKEQQQNQSSNSNSSQQ